MRVLLVDDHAVVRAGLRHLLESCDDLEVVGEAGTASEAIATALDVTPDVVVMDVRLPDGSGVEACRDIRSRLPDTTVVMLTSFDDDASLFESIMAGAAGYVTKQVHGPDLVDSIRRVGSGESILDPAVTARVMERIRHPALDSDARLARLTPTETRIVEMIAGGATNGQIGERLHLSEKTIKNYVSVILSKLEVSRRAEAAAYLADRRARQSRDRGVDEQRARAPAL